MVAMFLRQHAQRLEITDLPHEILKEFFELLPQILQGCFALSCRSLYHKFHYVFKEPMFRFPCSDGIDRTINIETRNHFLSRIQSQKGLWSYLTSPCWTYCNACLKLHPRTEFSGWAFETGRGVRCEWPGIIALCPYLIFSPRRLIRLGHELSKAGFDGDDIRKSIPDWHQCSFVSPCGKLSYSLNISPSLSQRGQIIFHFTY